MLGFDGGNFYNAHCTYLVPMLGWFLFSALLSSYNKFVFGDTHLAFPCPLLLTAIHFSCQWVYSYIISSVFPQTLGGTQVQTLTWTLFLGISIPCGLVAASDIGFSNLALVRITLTFYTMVKASTPIFVLLSAFLFGIAKITWALMGVALVICVGELLTVFGEVEFDSLGFIFCTIATVMSGIRWTLIELKLRDIQPPLKSSVAVMRILSPIMFIAMLILSLGWEQPWRKLKGTRYANSWEDALTMILLALLGAFLAICMISCEFYLLIKSSAIIIMIGGVIKELLNIVVG
jgi:solute carrier family 35 protein C2